MGGESTYPTHPLGERSHVVQSSGPFLLEGNQQENTNFEGPIPKKDEPPILERDLAVGGLQRN